MGTNRRLTFEERKLIEELLHQNMKHTDLCKRVGIHTTTLYRDLKKCKQAYNAEEAHANTLRGFHPVDWSIIGKRYGNLVVLEYANIYKNRTWWKCQCDCGKLCVISRKILADYCSQKRPLSCGCIPKQYKSKVQKLPIEELALRKYLDLLKFRELNGDCWDWKGYMQKMTPKTSWRSKAMGVRKCMFLLMNGLESDSRFVYAECGNHLCFNPDHITTVKPQNVKKDSN